MTHHARGTFDSGVKPLPAEEATGGEAVGRMSATGELAGLAGSMSIDIRDGRHFYDFEYTLPEVP